IRRCGCIRAGMRGRPMASVLIVSNIRVFDEAGMATGPGLRARGIAAALAARGHQTFLAEPQRGRIKEPGTGAQRTQLRSPGFAGYPPARFAGTRGRDGIQLTSWRKKDREFARMAAQADVVIVQPGTAVAAAFAGLETRCLVVDLYNPVMTE